jgi:hypothetical protein
MNRAYYSRRKPNKIEIKIMKLRDLAKTALICGASSAASTAEALNNGHLDNGWFNTQIVTTVKKDHSIDHTRKPHRLNGAKIIFDSGKNNCYSALVWGGPDSYLYGLYTFCNRSSGWEWDNFIILDELADGSLGVEWGSLYVPAPGTSRFQQSAEWAGYEGTLVLKTRIQTTGNKIKITPSLIQPRDGVIRYVNSKTGAIGTAPSGLKLKQVNISKVPSGALACLDSVLGKTGPTTICPQQTPPQ